MLMFKRMLVRHWQSLGLMKKGFFNRFHSKPTEKRFSGDEIEVLDKNASGWWKGRVVDKTGIFPSFFASENAVSSSSCLSSISPEKKTSQEEFVRKLNQK